MNDHPAAAELESFLRGSASQETSRRIVRHLLAACSPCRAALERMDWDRQRLEGLVSLVETSPEDLSGAVPGSADLYEQAFENAWSACERELAAPRSQRELRIPEDVGEADWAHLEDPIGAEDLVPEPRLIRLLLERSHNAQHRDPGKMLYWARQARALGVRCNAAAAGGEALLADLRSRAWGQFGNALRVAGRFREAARAFAAAERHRSAGTGDVRLRVELLGCHASLCRFERQFEEAIALLEEAEALCRESGDTASLARCLLQKAVAVLYSGEPEAAIRILDRTITYITPDDREMMFGAYHNLISCYVEAGRLQEALALVPRTRNIGEGAQDELMVLRVAWQEGKILCELGLLEEAEAQFSRARDGFMDADLAYEAALVSLDLTAVYVKLGLHAEVRRTIGDILPIFSSLRVGRELLASLIQLQQAEDQTQALQLIRALSRELVAGPKLPPSV